MSPTLLSEWQPEPAHAGARWRWRKPDAAGVTVPAHSCTSPQLLVPELTKTLCKSEPAHASARQRWRKPDAASVTAPAHLCTSLQLLALELTKILVTRTSTFKFLKAPVQS